MREHQCLIIHTAWYTVFLFQWQHATFCIEQCHILLHVPQSDEFMSDLFMQIM